MKIFDETGIQSQKPAFFAVLFFIAAISIAVSMLTGKIVPNLKDSVCGIALGVPNLFSSYCLIAALNELPSIVVFPTVAAATVMLIILIARFIFAEEIGRAGVAGIILTIISLIAINL
jgi:multidrug transporter EmrE-like cation transporter